MIFVSGESRESRVGSDEVIIRPPIGKRPSAVKISVAHVTLFRCSSVVRCDLERTRDTMGMDASGLYQAAWTAIKSHRCQAWLVSIDIFITRRSCHYFFATTCTRDSRVFTECGYLRTQITPQIALLNYQPSTYGSETIFWNVPRSSDTDHKSISRVTNRKLIITILCWISCLVIPVCFECLES